MALLPKACSYRGALLLHHRTLVGNSLRGSHIANELFNCKPTWSVTLAHPSSLRVLVVRELIVPAAWTPNNQLLFLSVVGSVACDHRIGRTGKSRGIIRMMSRRGSGDLGLLSLLHKLPSDEARLHAPRPKRCARENHVTGAQFNTVPKNTIQQLQPCLASTFRTYCNQS